jgi:hypothetical protein
MNNPGPKGYPVFFFPNRALGACPFELGSKSRARGLFKIFLIPRLEAMTNMPLHPRTSKHLVAKISQKGIYLTWID